MSRFADHSDELDSLNLSNIPDKKVCVRHFEEKSINAYIRKNYTQGYCDYCGKEVKVLSLEEILKFMMGGIGNFFEDAVQYQDYDSRNGGYQGNTFTVSEMIQEYIGLETHPFELTEDIVSSIDEIAWSDYYEHYDSPADDNTTKWEYFKNTVKNETRYFFKYRNSPDYYLTESFNAQDTLLEFGALLSKYNLFRVIPKDTDILRIRQHSIDKINEVKEITQLVSPSIEFARYANRFSPSGIPMFYGGFEKETIIKEVYDEMNTKSKRMTVGYFKCLNDIRVLDLTKIPRIPGIFEPKRHHHYFDLLFLHQLTQDLSLPVVNSVRFVPVISVS